MERIVKVIIADDHEVVRTGIRTTLNNTNFEIVGEATNGEEAIKTVENNTADIIIMDVSMPVMTGIEATKIIVEKHPSTKVLALTMFNEEQYIRQMLKAGAYGYILKNSGQTEILKALKNIADEKHYFSKEATDVIMSDMMNEKVKKVSSQTVSLTDREIDVLKLIAKEHTNQEIADQLFISIRTVDAHRRNLLQKIGARNAAGLAIYALNHNLLAEE